MYKNLSIESSATEGLVQQGFGKMGAEVQTSTFGILLYICTELSICTFNSPSSPSPKPLAARLTGRRSRNPTDKYRLNCCRKADNNGGNGTKQKFTRSKKK